MCWYSLKKQSKSIISIYWFITLSANHSFNPRITMHLLHLFAGTNTVTSIAQEYGIQTVSLDIKNYKNCPSQEILTDFLDWNFREYNTDHFDFILIGFPCDTFSKASGGHHFLNKKTPITAKGENSVLMIHKLKSVLTYFSSSQWIIENPTSALFCNENFNEIFFNVEKNYYRIHQKNYGHKLYKQTDLCSNINGIWLSNPVHRINKRYGKYKMDNLSYKERVSYPLEFARSLIEFFLINKI